MNKLIDWRCTHCKEVRIWNGKWTRPILCNTCRDNWIILLHTEKLNKKYGKNKNM